MSGDTFAFLIGALVGVCLTFLLMFLVGVGGLVMFSTVMH